MSKESDNRDAIRKIAEQLTGGMPGFDSMLDALSPKVVACRACRTKNRLRPGKANPRCGKCGLPLP